MSATNASASEVVALMEDVLEFLDRYSDVADGPDGQPMPNTAMELAVRIGLLVTQLSTQQAQEAQEAQKESTRF